MPEEDIAGIYLVKQAEAAFYALPPEKQKRLSSVSECRINLTA